MPALRKNKERTVSRHIGSGWILSSTGCLSLSTKMKERERERDKPERIHERSQERSDSMIP
jgi:hypothetical protein